MQEDELIRHFRQEPMFAREFVDNHNRINTPWFRIRCLFFYCLQRIRHCIVTCPH
jgi:hypothetical protein